MEGSRGGGTRVITVAGALLVLPVILDLLISGSRGLFRYMAADTFYYLQVARTWAATGLPSFDGEYPTNGFHPLWQALLAGVAWAADGLGLSATALMWAAVLSSLALLLVAVVLLGRAAERAHGRLSPWFALLPVGLYALTLIPLWIWFGSDLGRRSREEGPMPLYGTLWSFANGMESAVTVAAFAALVHVAVRHGFHARAGIAGLTGAAALLVLARLDTALIVGGWVLVLLVASWLWRDRGLAGAALVVAAGVGTVLVAYVLINLAYADRALPVSGAAKTSFPRPSAGNLRDLWNLFAGDHELARGRIYRLWPMVLGALAAAALLAVQLGGGVWRRARTPAGAPTALERYRIALAGTAVGVLALSAYDLLFVTLFAQGWWYLPVSIVLASLAGLEAVMRRPSAAPPARSGAVLAGCCAIGVAVFLALGRPAGYHERFADFHFDEAPRVRAFYGASPPRIFAWEDGADAFSLGFPALSGTGLMLDAEAWDAWYDGRLLDVALRRGYDRFSSVTYLDTTGLTRDSSAAQIRERLDPLLGGEDLEAYDFEVEYRSQPGRIAPSPESRGEYVVITMRRR